MEKRESKKIREVMARSTPTKETSSSASSNLVAEVQMLRDELSKKTEVIKQLEAMIPQRKRYRIWKFAFNILLGFEH
jgi:hypothetical protein